jgi:hypothetical protein
MTENRDKASPEQSGAGEAGKYFCMMEQTDSKPCFGQCLYCELQDAKAQLDSVRKERDELKRLIPIECCEARDPNCFGPRGCLVRAQQADRTPNDVLLARAEAA